MIRLDYEIIAEMVEPGSKVLDLGCGDGALLSLLKDKKNCRATGIEICADQIFKCVERGVSVAQGNIDTDLDVYEDKRFDYVILNESLQQVVNIEKVLYSALRVGKKVIVGIPNFCHIGARVQIFFMGKVPVTKSLPYKWYNTPNLRFLSLDDFREFCSVQGVTIERAYYLSNGNRITLFQDLFADSGIFVLKRA